MYHIYYRGYVISKLGDRLYFVTGPRPYRDNLGETRTLKGAKALADEHADWSGGDRSEAEPIGYGEYYGKRGGPRGLWKVVDALGGLGEEEG